MAKISRILRAKWPYFLTVNFIIFLWKKQGIFPQVQYKKEIKIPGKNYPPSSRLLPEVKWRGNPFFDVALSLPGASLSCLSKKVTKELSREGAELLAPASKAALPGAHPGALFRSCGFTGSIKEDMQLTNLKCFQELRNRSVAMGIRGIQRGER